MLRSKVWALAGISDVWTPMHWCATVTWCGLRTCWRKNMATHRLLPPVNIHTACRGGNSWASTKTTFIVVCVVLFCFVVFGYFYLAVLFYIYNSWQWFGLTRYPLMFVWPLDLLLVFEAFCITLSPAFCLDLENIRVNSFWFRYEDKLRRGFPCCRSLNISADQIVTIFHAKNLKSGCHVFSQAEALQQNWLILNETFRICNCTYSLMMRDIGCDQSQRR